MRKLIGPLLLFASLKGEKRFTLVAGGFAALMIGLALTGGWRGFSPIPYQDSWEGVQRFALIASERGWPAWWEVHVDHRLLLPRVLFWIEIQWLESGSRFLIACNYILVGALMISFWRALLITEGAEGPQRKAANPDLLGLGFLLIAWLSLWVQYQNYLWDFQSQMLLTFLLPLVTFLTMGLAGGGRVSGLRFALATSLGLASAGTMANGLAVLPLLTLMAALTGQGRARLVILVVLSFMTPTIYLWGHPLFSSNESVAVPAIDPLEAADHLLLFLGGPFFHLFGSVPPADWIARFAGFLFLAALLPVNVATFRQTERSVLRLALLFFTAFILVSAGAIALGRSHHGATQALQSRYMTGALCAWASLFVLYAPLLLQALNDRRRLAVLGGVTALGILMLAYQLRAVASPDQRLDSWSLAMLSLELGFADEPYQKVIYPDPNSLGRIAEELRYRDAYIFTIQPWAGLRERLGERIEAVPEKGCRAQIAFAQPVKGATNYLRVSGWYDGLVPEGAALLFTDTTAQVVGAAITGLATDLQEKPSKGRAFGGYLLIGRTPTSLVLAETPGSFACPITPISSGG